MRKKKLPAHAFSCMRGDKKIVGNYFLPEDYSGGKLPAVIVSHGFLVNMSTTKDYAMALADSGFAAFIFDFCGGGFGTKSDGATTEMTVFTEVEDLKAVIRYVRQQDFADDGNLTLMGCSQGGFVSAITAVQLKSEISGLILFYPALCIPDGAREGALMFAHFDPENIPEKMKCGPITIGHDYPACLLKVDALEAIAGYEGPVCIVHGDADQVVDVEYSKKAYRQYLGTDRPNSRVQLHILSGQGHGFKGEGDQTAVALVKEFLRGSIPLLRVDVRLTQSRRTFGFGKKQVSIFFTGKGVGQYFQGSIEEGASDEQDYRIGKPKRFCADYFLSGKDFTGKKCRVHIINRFDGKQWKPEVQTDSEALGFVNPGACRCVFENRKVGPMIRIFCDRGEKQGNVR